jgi:acetyltransferase-like isoleucine patch superfamily enzyme
LTSRGFQTSATAPFVERSERIAPLYTRERWRALSARARAEVWLRLYRARGSHLSWGIQPYFWEGRPVLRAPGQIVLGDQCRFRAGPVRTRLITGPEGIIKLGNSVGVSYGSEIYAAQRIEIGDNSIIGGLVTIYDTSFHPIDEGTPVKVAPVTIGRNVWVGRGVTILCGVNIASNAVVGSGAVVVKDVPANTLVAGNPAKPIRKVESSEGWRRT